jgi:hypothetical protein
MLLVTGFATFFGVQAALALPNCKIGDTSPICVCGKANCTPPPTVTYGSKSFQPSYLILSILYAPPGAASNVGFTNSTTEGATIGLSSSFGTGLSTKVSASGGFIGQGTVGASFGVSQTQSNSTTFQVTSTSSSGAQLSSTSDAIDHTQDRFFLWLNPLITVQQTGPKTATYTIGTVNGAQMDVIDIDLAEVKNTSLIPAYKIAPQVIHGVTVPGLGSLKPSDFTSIASMDTVTSITEPPFDAKRYVYVSTHPLEGPDQKGEDALKIPFSLSDGTSTSHVQTDSTNISTSVSVGAKVEIPGIFTVSVDDTASMTWNYANSSGATAGTAQQAAGTLGTAQAGCLEYVDVYSDTFFHTFAFVTEDPVCAPIKGAPTVPILKGLLHNAQGALAPHAMVTVTFPNGLVRRVFTDSKGEYEVYNPPTGTPQVSAPGMTVVAPALLAPAAPVAERQR